mmetsp:Transcript_15852/g.54130  ORF Transcript_15852/g.54130 Transcript_15852/m.54130 type:complete len:243 (-) Transcript_15852:475-1203(-)
MARHCCLLHGRTSSPKEPSRSRRRSSTGHRAVTRAEKVRSRPDRAPASALARRSSPSFAARPSSRLLLSFISTVASRRAVRSASLSLDCSASAASSASDTAAARSAASARARSSARRSSESASSLMARSAPAAFAMERRAAPYSSSEPSTARPARSLCTRSDHRVAAAEPQAVASARSAVWRHMRSYTTCPSPFFLRAASCCSSSSTCWLLARMLLMSACSVLARVSYRLRQCDSVSSDRST